MPAHGCARMRSPMAPPPAMNSTPASEDATCGPTKRTRPGGAAGRVFRERQTTCAESWRSSRIRRHWTKSSSSCCDASGQTFALLSRLASAGKRIQAPNRRGLVARSNDTERAKKWRPAPHPHPSRRWTAARVRRSLRASTILCKGGQPGQRGPEQRLDFLKREADGPDASGLEVGLQRTVPGGGHSHTLTIRQLGLLRWWTKQHSRRLRLFLASG